MSGCVAVGRGFLLGLCELGRYGGRGCAEVINAGRAGMWLAGQVWPVDLYA